MSTSNPVRELPFDHEGDQFAAKAAPIGDGWDLGLWKNGKRVEGRGRVSDENIRDAKHTNPDADLVGEALAAIRDAVLTENVRDPEPPEADDDDADRGDGSGH